MVVKHTLMVKHMVFMHRCTQYIVVYDILFTVTLEVVLLCVSSYSYSHQFN